MRTLHREARACAGDGRLTGKNNGNEARDARSFIRRWGLEWNVPFRSFKHVDAHNETVMVYYISPLDFVKYLLEKTPEVVLGGHFNEHDGKQQLQAFWDNYEQCHPTHMLFQENHAERVKSNCLALSFHGDEGRGLKKGNTAIVMFESNLGVDTGLNYHKKRRMDQCQECYLRKSSAKWFKTNMGYRKQHDNYHACPTSFETHNTKCNSFLTKYVMAALPNSLYKESNALDTVIKNICDDFRVLFETGVVVRGERWFAAVTGLKGDLRWYEKIAKLKRCFSRQLGEGLEMCHECGAGSAEKPFEDWSHTPSWGTSIFEKRPWEEEPDIVRIPFEPQGGKAEMVLRRDLFHNSKVGLLRDFIGSMILLLVKLGYFNDTDSSNERGACLERAHAHFYWFCKTIVGRKAALRSFTTSFLNAK